MYFAPQRQAGATYAAALLNQTLQPAKSSSTCQAVVFRRKVEYWGWQIPGRQEGRLSQSGISSSVRGVAIQCAA